MTSDSRPEEISRNTMLWRAVSGSLGIFLICVSFVWFALYKTPTWISTIVGILPLAATIGVYLLSSAYHRPIAKQAASSLRWGSAIERDKVLSMLLQNSSNVLLQCKAIILVSDRWAKIIVLVLLLALFFMTLFKYNNIHNYLIKALSMSAVLFVAVAWVVAIACRRDYFIKYENVWYLARYDFLTRKVSSVNQVDLRNISVLTGADQLTVAIPRAQTWLRVCLCDIIPASCDDEVDRSIVNRVHELMLGTVGAENPIAGPTRSPGSDDEGHPPSESR